MSAEEAAPDPGPTTLVLSQVCSACAQRHAVAVELGDERYGYYLAEQRRLQCEQRAGWYRVR